VLLSAAGERELGAPFGAGDRVGLLLRPSRGAGTISLEASDELVVTVNGKEARRPPRPHRARALLRARAAAG